MLALEKPKDMAVAKPRRAGERVNPKAALRDAMKNYPQTMAHLAK